LSLSLHPLSTLELGDDFDLKHSLKYGHLPCAYTEEDPKAYLQSYYKTYLEEEVKQEGLTRNLGAFARFMESASFSQGSVLNVTSVAQDCAVERKVVENYFSILEDLLIAYRIPVFAKRAKRRLVKHQKFYFFDVGVYRAIRPSGPLDRPEEIDGIALETLLFQELISVNSNFGLDYKLHFWRTSNGLEVDFVLYGDKGMFAFEIKRVAKIRSGMLSGLKSFHRDYPEARIFFVYGGNRVMHDGEIEIVPIDWLFKNLKNVLTGKRKWIKQDF